MVRHSFCCEVFKVCLTILWRYAKVLTFSSFSISNAFYWSLWTCFCRLCFFLCLKAFPQLVEGFASCNIKWSVLESSYHFNCVFSGWSKRTKQKRKQRLFWTDPHWKQYHNDWTSLRYKLTLPLHIFVIYN